MAVNENDPLHPGNQPGQQQPVGYKQQATSLDHEGEQQAYGQDHDATNHNRDLQHVNAAHQPSQSQPDFKAQGREGQQPHPQGDPPRTGNQEPDPRKQDDDIDGDEPGKVIPEVPLRREEREKQTPKANPGDPEEIDRSNTDKDTQFPIDDSSKFSE